MTRNAIYRYSEHARSGNFIRRVRAGGGGFLDASDAPVALEKGDVLLTLGEGPWLAQFRDASKGDGATEEPAAEPPATPKPKAKHKTKPKADPQPEPGPMQL